MMSSKLALRNVKNSFRDYAIYFLTITFGVCIFYVFNSIESQQAMMVISSSQYQALQALTEIIGGASVLVSIIFGILILYANRFMVRRRKKELGIYMTLGMGKGQISRILILETVIVGVVSLVVGLVLGIFLSQGLAVVTAKLFEAKLSTFRFIFSSSALLKVILYFGVTFVLVMIFNAFTIEKQKLIDLLYAERKNEKFKTPRLALSVCLFVLSLICLSIAYVLILGNKYFEINAVFWTSIVLGCVGTFLFFFSLSGFFLKLISMSKRVYLKNLNMFVLRQLGSKINTTYISLTLVCLLLFISICTLSAGVGVANATTTELHDVTPFDATFSINVREYEYDDVNMVLLYEIFYDVDIADRLMERGIDISSFAKEYTEIDFFDPKVSVSLSAFGNSENYIPIFIKLSEYNAVLEMQGKNPISLNYDEFAVNTNVTTHEWQQTLQGYLRDNPEIVIDDTAYHSSLAHLHEATIQVSYGKFDMMTIIVPDAALEGYTAVDNMININYIESNNEYKVLCEDAFYDNNLGYSNEQYGIGWSIQTKINIFESAKTTSTTIAYLAIYMGIVFLITSATILAIAQLSEASDNVSRYGLLRKLGTESSMVNKALLMQILVYFGVPLILAIIHSVVGLLFASYVVKLVGGYSILRDSVFMAGVLVVIYGIYFIATYSGSKRIINR